MVEYFKLAISKFAEFTGRSRRKEFWYFYLGYVVLSMVASVLGFILGETIGAGLSGLVFLATIIPFLAVSVRRLHDVGRSGWWLLIYFTLIGIIVLVYWFASDSEPGANQYGPNPKTGATATDISSHLVD